MKKASAAGSPKTARAGHKMRLSPPGASLSSTANRGTAIVPNETIAANCSPMAKAAPITAATICEIDRVRLAPMAANSAPTIRIATATASIDSATTTA